MHKCFANICACNIYRKVSLHFDAKFSVTDRKLCARHALIVIAYHLFSQLILDLTLYQTPHIARSVFNREGTLGDKLYGIVRIAEGYSLFAKNLAEISKHNTRNSLEVFFGKRRKHHNFINTVQKFWAQE